MCLLGESEILSQDNVQSYRWDSNMFSREEHFLPLQLAGRHNDNDSLWRSLPEKIRERLRRHHSPLQDITPDNEQEMSREYSPRFKRHLHGHRLEEDKSNPGRDEYMSEPKNAPIINTSHSVNAGQRDTSRWNGTQITMWVMLYQVVFIFIE